MSASVMLPRGAGIAPADTSGPDTIGPNHRAAPTALVEAGWAAVLDRPTAVAFDCAEELLWQADVFGRLTAHTLPEMRLQASVWAHESAVSSVVPCAEGVLSVSAGAARLHDRGGVLLKHVPVSTMPCHSAPGWSDHFFEPPRVLSVLPIGAVSAPGVVSAERTLVSGAALGGVSLLDLSRDYGVSASTTWARGADGCRPVSGRPAHLAPLATITLPHTAAVLAGSPLDAMLLAASGDGPMLSLLDPRLRDTRPAFSCVDGHKGGTMAASVSGNYALTCGWALSPVPGAPRSPLPSPCRTAAPLGTPRCPDRLLRLFDLRMRRVVPAEVAVRGRPVTPAAAHCPRVLLPAPSLAATDALVARAAPRAPAAPDAPAAPPPAWRGAAASQPWLFWLRTGRLPRATADPPHAAKSVVTLASGAAVAAAAAVGFDGRIRAYDGAAAGSPEARADRAEALAVAAASAVGASAVSGASSADVLSPPPSEASAAPAAGGFERALSRFGFVAGVALVPSWDDAAAAPGSAASLAAVLSGSEGGVCRTGVVPASSRAETSAALPVAGRLMGATAPHTAWRAAGAAGITRAPPPRPALAACATSPSGLVTAHALAVAGASYLHGAAASAAAPRGPGGGVLLFADTEAAQAAAMAAGGAGAASLPAVATAGLPSPPEPVMPGVASAAAARAVLMSAASLPASVARAVAARVGPAGVTLGMTSLAASVGLSAADVVPVPGGLDAPLLSDRAAAGGADGPAGGAGSGAAGAASRGGSGRGRGSAGDVGVRGGRGGRGRGRGGAGRGRSGTAGAAGTGDEAGDEDERGGAARGGPRSSSPPPSSSSSSSPWWRPGPERPLSSVPRPVARTVLAPRRRASLNPAVEEAAADSKPRMLAAARRAAAGEAAEGGPSIALPGPVSVVPLPASSRGVFLPMAQVFGDGQHGYVDGRGTGRAVAEGRSAEAWGARVLGRGQATGAAPGGAAEAAAAAGAASAAARYGGDIGAASGAGGRAASGGSAPGGAASRPGSRAGSVGRSGSGEEGVAWSSPLLGRPQALVPSWVAAAADSGGGGAAGLSAVWVGGDVPPTSSSSPVLGSASAPAAAPLPPLPGGLARWGGDSAVLPLIQLLFRLPALRAAVARHLSPHPQCWATELRLLFDVMDGARDAAARAPAAATPPVSPGAAVRSLRLIHSLRSAGVLAPSTLPPALRMQRMASALVGKVAADLATPGLGADTGAAASAVRACLGVVLAETSLACSVAAPSGPVSRRDDPPRTALQLDVPEPRAWTAQPWARGRPGLPAAAAGKDEYAAGSRPVWRNGGFVSALRAALFREWSVRGWTDRVGGEATVTTRTSVTGLPPVMLVGTGAGATAAAAAAWGTPHFWPAGVSIAVGVDGRGGREGRLATASGHDPVVRPLSEAQLAALPSGPAPGPAPAAAGGPPPARTYRVAALLGSAAPVSGAGADARHDVIAALVDADGRIVTGPSAPLPHRWVVIAAHSVREASTEEVLGASALVDGPGPDASTPPSQAAADAAPPSRGLGASFTPALVVLVATDAASTPAPAAAAVPAAVFGWRFPPVNQPRLPPMPDPSVPALPGPGDVVALDAEFVAVALEERRPSARGAVITARARLAPARVSVLRADGSTLFDDWVCPAEPVVDHLTRFSGVKPGELDPATSRRRLVAERAVALKLRALVDLGVVWVGHGLRSDFAVLGICPPERLVRDTASLYCGLDGRVRKLKTLAAVVLGRQIQTDSAGHSSVEDALAALMLYRRHGELTAAGDGALRAELHRVEEAAAPHAAAARRRAREQERSRAAGHPAGADGPPRWPKR